VACADPFNPSQIRSVSAAMNDVIDDAALEE
jgi:hypothetical protein